MLLFAFTTHSTKRLLSGSHWRAFYLWHYSHLLLYGRIIVVVFLLLLSCLEANESRHRTLVGQARVSPRDKFGGNFLAELLRSILFYQDWSYLLELFVITRMLLSLLEWVVVIIDLVGMY